MSISLDRSKTTLKRLGTDDDDDFVNLPHSERVLMVWPITREIWGITNPGNAEQRLQRNITALIRRKS